MKSTWRQWLWKVLGDRRAGSVSCRVNRRPRVRPTLEILEDRTLPSGVFPFVESINRTTPLGPSTNASSVVYTVTFSEPVTGVNPTDFKVVTTGTVGTTLTQVTPPGPSAVYTATVSGITGNGTLGLNLVDNNSIRDLAGDGLVQAKAGASFSTNQTYAYGLQAVNSVAVADLNGDGKPDLVYASYAFVGGPPNKNNGKVAVLLGNGNGTFHIGNSNNPAPVTYSPGTVPESVAVADLIGDGKPDLAVALYSTTTASSVSVLAGNGDGTFQFLTSFSTGTGHQAVATADVNGDAKPDILVADSNTGTVKEFINNGNGTFTNQGTFAVGTNPFSIAVADFNGDNKPDLLTANAGSNNVSVLLGNGDGSFQSQLLVPTGLSPQSVALADVNGDGNPDLILGYTNSRSVSVLLGNGNGTFQTAATFALLGNLKNPASVAVGDLNGDGRADLVNTTSSTTSGSIGGVGVFLNAGNGNFTGQVYTIDTVAPFVQSINRTTPAGQITNATSVAYTVTFSEPVTGVNPTDFQLATTGTVGTTLTQVTPPGPSAAYTVTVSGITGNGTLGLNLVDNGSIHDLAGNPLTQQNAPAAFQAQETFATSGSPWSLALGDVNGDGKLDLVVANDNSATVSVLLGNGNGTFQTQQSIATGSDPVSVALGDVNGDGKPDLAVANNQSGTVSVLLGNGNGTFQAQQTIVTGTYPASVALGDVNGDGKLDLVVTNGQGNNLSVLLGNGNGTFQAQQTFATGVGPFSVVEGDLNGDGKPDLAVANFQSGTVSVLLGNGNGTFQAQQIFATGSDPNQVALGDVNGDGQADLAVANDGSNTVSVLLGNGNGTFQAQQVFATGLAPTSVALGDVNGDGKPDLAVANAGNINTMSVLLGNGNGTFQAQQTLAAGSATHAVAFGDVNADGKPDLVVTNLGSDTVSVLLNAGNGNFTGQVYTVDTIDPYVVSINRTTPAGPVTNATTVTYTVTFTEPVTGVNLADFQLALSTTVGATLSQVTPVSGSVYTVTISNIVGAGTLGLNLVDNNSIHDLAGNPLTQQNAPASFQSTQTYGVGFGALAVAEGDVNGDGKPDLVVANGSNTVSVLLGNGDGSFQAQETFAAGPLPFSVALGDLNGDGKLDIAVADYTGNTVGVLLGNGNGTFQAESTFQTGAGPRSVVIGDFNGDGKPDLAITNERSNTVSVLLGNGNGTFQAQETFAAGVYPQGLVVGDVNGDGKPDLAAANSRSNTVSVLLGNGDGTFQAQETFATRAAPYSLALGDLNGDGNPDLAIATQASSVSVLLGNGNGTFQAQQTFPTTYGSRSVAIGDFNGDGKLDLAEANPNHHAVSILLGNGDGTFQAQQTIGTPFPAQLVAAGDLNRDGRLDLAVASTSGGAAVGILVNAGNGNFTGQVYTINTIDTIDPYVVSINRTTPAGPVTNATTVTYTVTFSEPVTGVNLTDFQLALSSTVGATLSQVTPVSGAVYTVTISNAVGAGTLGLNLVDNNTIHDLAGNPLTQQNAPAGFQSSQTFAVGSGARAVAEGDLTGDGKSDLVVVNRFNPTVSILLGNGNGTFQAQQTIATAGGQVAVAIGDVNGDGIPDLAIANNYGIGLLLGNGNGTFQAQQTLSTGPRPYAVAIGDVNGDGTSDLVVANYNGASVSVLLGNGNGTFQAQQTFGTGPNPKSVAVADVNGDGKPDLVLAGYNGAAVSVLLGNGNGTFQAAQTISTGGFATSVAVGDVNGDGFPDLAVANSSNGTVSVLLGNGNGTFQAQQTFAAGSFPTALVLGDVNGDGKPDLAVTNPGFDTVSVLLGNGNGTFQARQIFAAGNGALSMALGDVNGDGRPDLVEADNGSFTVSVLLNAGNGNFTGQVYTIVNPAATHFVVTAQPATVAGANMLLTVVAEDQFNNTATGYSGTVNFSSSDTGASTVMPASSPLSGGLGTFSATLTTAGNRTITAVQGTATGTSNTIVVSAAAATHLVIMAPAATVAGNGFTFTVAAEDQFNNIAPNFIGTVAFSSSDNGPSTSLPSPATLTAGVGLFSATLTKAGSQSLTVTDDATNTVTGASTFQFAQASGSPFAASTNPYGIAAGDFAGNGILDLAVANFNGFPPGYISVLLGNGNGTFGPATSYAVGNPALSQQPEQIVVADLNGDGKPDLAVTDYDGNSVAVLLGNGNGTFQAALNTDDIIIRPNGIAAADVNHDGKTDLLVATGGTGAVDVLLGNGNGTFQSPLSATVGTGQFGIAVGDFNHDGNTDLAVANYIAVSGGNTVSVLLGNGNGTFGAPVSYALGAQGLQVAAADLTGDGQQDLVVTSGLGNSVSVLLGNSNGTFQAATSYAVGASPFGVAVGDVDGNGIPDLVVVSRSGSVNVLFGNGNGTFHAAQTISVPGNNPYDVVLGDLNADGLPDLAVTALSSNSVDVLLSQRILTSASASITVSPAPATHFVVSAPSSTTAGSSMPFTVVAEDQFNNTATGFTGSVSFSSTDTSPNTSLPIPSPLSNGQGTFSATLTTAGSQTLTATDGTITGTSGSITVSAVLHFFISAPANTTADYPIIFTVTAKDQSNNTATGYSGTVFFSSSDGQALFSSPTATLLSGSGVFAANLKTAGNQTITATDTTASTITGASGPILVTAAPANHLVATLAVLPSYPGVPGAYQSPAPASSFASTGAPVVFTVAAEDPFNNLSPTYTGTVAFASTDTAAVLPQGSTLTSGLGTFSGTLGSAGNQFITATDVSNPTINGATAAIVTRGLVVTSFTPTPTGFVINFNKPFNPSTVLIYTNGTTPDDIILKGTATQPILGSALFNSPTAPTSITFVKTDVASAVGTFNPGSGLLSAGNYTVTLRTFNAGNGFQDSLGTALDGKDTANPGTNYVYTFSVSAPPTAVGIPDFARGASNTDAVFLPTTIGNGNTFNLVYTNPNTSPATGTATVTFSTIGATLQAYIQAALNALPQIGLGAGSVPNAEVVANSPLISNGVANVQVTFQNSGFVTATSQLLSSTSPNPVTFALATINAANNVAGDGIPLALSNGQNVTSGSFTLQYNPTLLSITGGAKGAALTAIAGSSFTVTPTINNATSASAVISFSSPSKISSTTASLTLGSLLATVPFSTTASYGAKQLLHFSSEQLNTTASSNIAVTNQDAVEVAAFFGDVNDTGIPFPSNGAVGAIAVVASLNPSTVFQTLPGFALFPCLDPVIIGGVAETGQRDIVSNDNTVMNNQLTLGQTQIPWLPAGLSVTPVGPDPTLSVPTNLVASPGGTVIVPVNIDTARPEGIGMVEGVLALTYDPKVFDVSAADVQLGTVPGAGGGWQLKTEVNAQTGLIGVELYSSTAIQSSVGGSLVTIAMHVRQTAPVGTTGLTLVPYVDPTGGAGVYETSLLGAGGEFILHPAATSAGLEPGVPGLVTIAAQAPVAGGLMMVSQAAAAVSVPAVPSSFDVQAASRAASSALALAVVEEVFAGLAETAQWVQETALVQPGVILTSESNDQGTTTRVRDLALSVSNLAPGESPGANYNTAEWLPGDWLASLGQTSRRGLLASAADPVDGAAEDADQAGLEAYFAREAGAFRLP